MSISVPAGAVVHDGGANRQASFDDRGRRGNLAGQVEIGYNPGVYSM